MSDLIYYKNGEETFRISPPTAETKCPETKLEVKKMTEKERIQGEIKVLQSKLALLEEMENFKTPAEEAFKRVYNYYPPTTPSVSNFEDIRWREFELGYIASQKDYKVGEYEPTPQETQMTLEKSGEFSIVSYNGETYYRNLYDGICGGWYKTYTNGEVFYLVEDETERKLEKLYQEQVVVEEPKKEQKWGDIVRESVKWCEEHREESVEDYLTPQGPQGPVGPGPGPKGVIVGYEAHQSLVDDANKIKSVASMTNCIIEGNPPNGCSAWNEWFELFGSKGILHNLRISAKEYQSTSQELEMTAFTYKGYGRIYTDREYIENVENIIQELDEFEWGYYPEGLVTSWDRYPNVEYVGKFELNEEKFKQICKERNIPVFIFDAGMSDYPSGYYPAKPLSKEEIQQLSYGELK